MNEGKLTNSSLYSLNGREICSLNSGSPFLQTSLVVFVQVADQISAESRHTLSIRTVTLRFHLVAPWTDPNPLTAVPPIVLVEICCTHNHSHRSICVAEQHDFAVVSGKGVVHLDLKRSHIRPDLLYAK